jgi:hypothetical protein
MSRELFVATFDRPEDVLNAVRTARQENFRIYDVFSPYPIHDLDRVMGLRKTRLPVITLLGCLAGLTAAAALQYYTTVLDWPMNVGGKPDVSTLAFIPIAFELTVLFGGLASVAALFLRARLFPGKTEYLIAEGITDSTFAVALRVYPSFDMERAREVLGRCGAREIGEVSANL